MEAKGRETFQSMLVLFCFVLFRYRTLNVLTIQQNVNY